MSTLRGFSSVIKGLVLQGSNEGMKGIRVFSANGKPLCGDYGGAGLGLCVDYVGLCVGVC